MSVSVPTSTLERFTTFGDLLRFLRRRVGITQSELAAVVGSSDRQNARPLASASTPGTERFLAIVGASGSGKSSFVRAGFVPALHWDKNIGRLADPYPAPHRSPA